MRSPPRLWMAVRLSTGKNTGRGRLFPAGEISGRRADGSMEHGFHGRARDESGAGRCYLPRTGLQAGGRVESAPEQAFPEAAVACLDALYGFALALTRDREAARDLVQETYLRALRARNRASGEGLRS
ncbi:MAG TPA: sigma factor, partial [Vicinamibacteria bacterium]|nr:sigma factor [Vicinamibacteria bacterium]